MVPQTPWAPKFPIPSASCIWNPYVIQVLLLLFPGPLLLSAPNTVPKSRPSFPRFWDPAMDSEQVSQFLVCAFSNPYYTWLLLIMSPSFQRPSMGSYSHKPKLLSGSQGHPWLDRSLYCFLHICHYARSPSLRDFSWYIFYAYLSFHASKFTFQFKWHFLHEAFFDSGQLKIFPLTCECLLYFM